MKKPMFLMIAGVLLVVGILGGVKFFQIRSAMAQFANFQPPPEAVTTTIAREEVWDTTLPAIGTVVAVNGVTVSADLPGLVEQILFESGRAVSKGQILVRLDVKQERASLAAAEAQRELARLDLQRKKELMAKDAIPQATYDRVAAEYKGAEARVGEARAAIERKVIRAPFSGVLGIRQVNLGEYVAPGAPIVPLQSLEPVYVRFTVPQQEASTLQVGSTVEVTSEGMQGTEFGKVTAVNAVVDEATRNIEVQATFENKPGKLRPGMFVQTALVRGTKNQYISLPASAIAYAPYGDSVYIVEGMKGQDGKTYTGVRQQFVKLGPTRGDQVAVLSGVKAGEEVVTSGAFKLRPGASVQVNNSVQPAGSSAPRPEDS